MSAVRIYVIVALLSLSACNESPVNNALDNNLLIPSPAAGNIDPPSVLATNTEEAAEGEADDYDVKVEAYEKQKLAPYFVKCLQTKSEAACNDDRFAVMHDIDLCILHSDSQETVFAIIDRCLEDDVDPETIVS